MPAAAAPAPAPAPAPAFAAALAPATTPHPSAAVGVEKEARPTDADEVPTRQVTCGDSEVEVSVAGKSWIDDVVLRPEDPALTAILVAGTTRWTVPKASLIPCEGSPLLLQVANGLAKVVTLRYFSVLHAGIPLKRKFLMLNVNGDAKCASNAVPDHFCGSAPCGREACVFRGVPKDACRTFMTHGMCAADHCRFRHYFLVAEEVASTGAAGGEYGLTVMRSKLSVGNCCIAPWFVAVETAERLNVRKTVMAVAANKKSAEIGAKARRDGERRIDAVQQIEAAKARLYADHLASLGTLSRLYDAMGDPDSREKPTKAHRAEHSV